MRNKEVFPTIASAAICSRCFFATRFAVRRRRRRNACSMIKESLGIETSFSQGAEQPQRNQTKSSLRGASRRTDLRRGNLPLDYSAGRPAVCAHLQRPLSKQVRKLVGRADINRLPLEDPHVGIACWRYLLRMTVFLLCGGGSAPCKGVRAGKRGEGRRRSLQ